MEIRDEPRNEILIVDDTQVNVSLLKVLLREAGYNIHTAENGEVALEAASSLLPDLILLDVKMPGMDGFEVCRHLKAKESTVNIPVIFISAFDDEAARVNGFKAGGTDFISLPIHKEELLARVKNQLKISQLQFEQQKQNDRLLKEIEQRQLAETALKSSEERFRMLFEKAPCGYQSLDEHGHIIEVNESWMQLFGYTSEEVSGKWFGDFLTPPCQDDFRQRFDYFKQKGEIQSEYEMIHKNGSLLSIAFDGKIGYDATGVFKQTHCILQNISERRQLENKLLAQKNTYEQILEQSLAGYWDWDIPTGDEYLSPAFKAMFGYEEHEIENRAESWQKLIFEEDLPGVFDVYKRHVQSKGSEAFYNEVRYHHKNGSAVWVICTGKVIEWDDSGNPKRMIGCHINISERKQAEETLRQHAELLAQSQNIAHVGNWEFDLAANHLTWSDETYRIFGLKPQEFAATYESFLEFIHPDDRNAVDAAYTESVRNGKYSYEIEHRVVRKHSGEIRFVHEKCLHECNAKGELVRSIGIVQDITERKLAELKLNESEARFRHLFQNIPNIAVQGYSYDGTTHYWNKASENLYGYTAQEAIGKNLFDLIIPMEIRGPVEQSIQQMAEKGQPIPASELSLMHKNGTRVSVFSSHAIMQTPGEAPELYCMNIDMSERKKAEAALQESEERYKALHNASFGGIAIHEKGIILECNRGLAELTGYAYQELIGMDGLLLLAETSRNSVMDKITSGYEKPYEAIGLRKNGEEYPLRMEGRNISYKGKQARTVEFRDITEQKKTEEALINSEEKFRLLAENSPSIIYRVLLKPEMKFDYVSPSATVITGYTPQEHYADPQLGFKLVHPDDRKLLEDTTQYSNGAPLMLRWVKKDGTIIWTEQRNVLIFDQNNQPIAIEGEARDITERKKTDEALKTSEENYRHLLQNIHAGVVVHAADSSILYANSHACQLLGLSFEQMIGKTAIDPEWHFVQEDLTPLPFEQYPAQYVINNKIPLRELVLGRILPETNTYFWALANAFPEFNTDGSLRQVLVTFIDITELKQAQNKLQVALVKYKTLFECFPLGITVADKQGSILETNPIAEKLLDVPQEEHIQRDIDGSQWQIVRPDGTPMPTEEFASVRALKENRQVTDVEIGIIRRDNSCTWLNVTATPIPLEDYGVVVTYTDITKRKQTEEALEKRIIALTMPLENLKDLRFDDLFNIDSLQKLQDDFSTATGVASIITHPDGTPITKPSNFTFFCSNVIRSTEKGCANCLKSDTLIGKSLDAPIIQTCLSAGLWDAGSGISVGGKHIANWLIGQVRDEEQKEEIMLKYAKEIGADENEFIEAFRKVPVMGKEQFKNITQALFTLSSQLSVSAYQNVQQARFITQRKQAEEALQKSRDFLDNIINASASPVFVKDDNHKVCIVNDAFCSLINTPREKLIGTTGFEYFPATEAKKYHANDQQVFDSGKENISEESYISQSGVESTFITRKTIFTDTSGNKYLVAVLNDITERKQAEKSLKQSELQNRTILQTALDGFWMIDKQSRFMEVNNAYCKLTGYSRDELLTMMVADVEVLDDEVNVQQRIQKLMQNGSDRFESKHRCKDGRIIDMEVSVNFLADNQSFFVFLHDITERQQAQEALSASEKEFRKLAESMPQIVWICEANGNNIYYNQHWVDYTGLTLEESYGAGWNKPFHPDEQEHAWNAWQNAINKNGIYSLECRLRRHDGEYFWWLIRGIPVLNEKGEIVKWFGTCTDIHDMKLNDVKIQDQLNELRRWNEVMLDREERVLELKLEVNKLLLAEGKPIRYASVENNSLSTEFSANQ